MARRSIKILYFNSNSVAGKIDTIRAQVDYYKPHIISITETKIDKDFDDNELFGPNYIIYRKDRTKGGGGVLIAICNLNRAFNILGSDTGPGESVKVKLQMQSKSNFNLVTVYRPPNEHNLDNLDRLMSENNNSLSPTIYIGDFNLPDIDWARTPNHGQVKANSNRKPLHEKALQIFRINNLTQIIHGATHRKGNTLDLVLVEKELLNEMNVQCEILPRLSDHHMVLVSLVTQQYTDKRATGRPQHKLNLDNAKFSEINKLFESLHSEIQLPYQSIEHQWHKFTETIKTATDQYIPTKLARPGGKPWMTRELVRLIRHRDRLFRRNKKYPTSVNLREEREINKSVAHEITKAKKHYLNEHVEKQLSNGNTKPLFSYIIFKNQKVKVTR